MTSYKRVNVDAGCFCRGASRCARKEICEMAACRGGNLPLEQKSGICSRAIRESPLRNGFKSVTPC